MEPRYFGDQQKVHTSLFITREIATFGGVYLALRECEVSINRGDFIFLDRFVCLGRTDKKIDRHYSVHSQ